MKPETTYSTQQVALKLGISRTSLMNYLREYGFRPRMKKITIEIEQLAWSRGDIAKIIG